jgi:hypothetical protein
MAAWLTPVAAEETSAVPTVVIPRVDRPPRLEDFAAMAPDGEGSGQMARVDGFLQRLPSDGAPVSERTEAYLGYDARYLYAVFVCFDREPNRVRARMTNRNEIFADDFVTVQFDTFRDQRRSYVFGTNALGIQGDAIWVEGVGFDQTFDTVFDSRGILTAQGYVTWMRIPFKSLRFPATRHQTWGLLLTRDIPRKSEESFWPQYTLKIDGRLNQVARLEGLEAVSPGRNLQVLPFGLFRAAVRSLDLRDPSAPRFVSDATQGDAGVDVKLVIRDAMVLDLTANPDFSHVESDLPQVTTNQRFEVFFPEKRPFFLENASYFDTPVPLLFTRRITDPRFGARLTGKLGGWGIGVLAADDEAPGKAVPDPSPRSGRRAGVRFARITRDLSTQSFLGIVYSERALGGARNRVSGLDGRFRLGSNWVAGVQGLASWTRSLDGRELGGPAWDAFLRRKGSHATYDLTYNDRSEGFRAETGFVPRTDIRHVAQTAEYLFRPQRGRVLSWGPTTVTDANWDHQGTLLDWLVRPRVGVTLPGQTSSRVGWSFAGERIRPRDFPGLAASVSHSVDRGTVEFESSPLPVVSLRASTWFAGHGTNFVPAAGRPPTRERLYFGDFGLTMRPTRHLTVDNAYLLTRLARSNTGERIFSNHIFRTRWNYQLTPRLAIRAIARYDVLRTDPAFTSLPATRAFNGDLLVSYRVNPWTAVYAGYNGNLQNLEPDLALGPEGLRRTRTGVINDGRQFFVKVSYLLRP